MSQQAQSGKRCCVKFLHAASVGKIQLGLYYRNSLEYGSTFGGIISIILAFVIIGYSVVLLIPVLDGTGSDFNFYNREISHYMDVSEIKNDDVLTKFTNIKVIVGNIPSDSDHFCEDYVTLKWNIKYFDNSSSNIAMNQIAELKFMTLGTLNSNTVLCRIEFESAYQVLSQSGFGSGNAILQSDMQANQSQYQLNSTWEITSSYKSAKIQQSIIKYSFFKFNSDQQDEQYRFLTLSYDYSLATLSLSIYKKSNSILGIFPQFQSKLVIDEIDSFYQYGMEHDSMLIDFEINPQLQIIKREPYNLFTAFTKIGGLLAFAKIFITVIKVVHQKRFQQKLKKLSQKEKECAKGKVDEQSEHLISDLENKQIYSINGGDSNVIQPMKEPDNIQNIQEIFSYKSYIQMYQQIQELQNRIDQIEIQAQFEKKHL